MAADLGEVCVTELRENLEGGGCCDGVILLILDVVSERTDEVDELRCNDGGITVEEIGGFIEEGWEADVNRILD